MLAVDNGPEFCGRDLDRWAYEHGVKLFFIDPGKPMQNGSVESFNGRFREECLDPSWFTSLAEARRVIEAWPYDRGRISAPAQHRGRARGRRG
jgi:putative transposase